MPESDHAYATLLADRNRHAAEVVRLRKLFKDTTGAWPAGAPPSDTTPTGAPAEPTNDPIGAVGHAVLGPEG